MVGTDKADEKPDRGAAHVLGDPRRPGEMVEPEPWQQVMELPAAPPVVDSIDKEAVIP